jgi:hypothetical protein
VVRVAAETAAPAILEAQVRKDRNDDCGDIRWGDLVPGGGEGC